MFTLALTSCGGGSSKSDGPEKNVCVITHNGGAPLSLSTVKVDSTGASIIVDTQILSDDDDADTFEERQAITACGTHVYAAQRGDGSIAILEANDDGSLVFKSNLPHPDIFALQCLADKDILVAISSPPPGIETLPVTAYSVAGDGQLSLTNTLTLAFAGGGDFREWAPTVVNPVTGELWVVGYFSTLGPGGAIGGSRGFRIGVNAGGMAVIREGPVDIGGSDAGLGIDIGNNGTQMAMAGLKPDCTSTWSLPAGGALPTAVSQQTSCGGSFSNGLTLVARSGNTVFYQGHPGSTIRIHDLTGAGVVLLDEQPTASHSRLMELLYDDSVLFSIGKVDGVITVFNASADGTVLSEVVDTLVVPITDVKALTTVPCL